MKAISLILLVFLFVGCASKNIEKSWHHPEKSAEQMRVDMLECDYEATQAVPGYEDAYSMTSNMPLQTRQREAIVEKCLKAKGYQLVSKEDKQ